MEQARLEKGRAQDADADPAEPGSKRARRRQEQLGLARGLAGVAVDAAAVPAEVRDAAAWVPAPVAAAVAVGKQDSNRTKGE